MASNGLPHRVTAGLYIAAGVMFIAGAVASQRLAFGGVGVAFIVLGVAIVVRQRKSKN
ncbi:MFS transporter [Pseudoxanthomonas daejeonensis]|uniref:MFS transporter n=1 Tax=Pseudoxanthomonas daejeonensis TaxID=266062 RepID=A0ABQ6Z9N5_9GAMM|nr:MFS transporter [Pseudoxanthomonas daejeonensis]KAF1696380.1 MFS transporter [Pseudoxanthomonas daejeonensis]UNK57053.1 MFS transporter [Pseudoxanthomonas daejeonensis]